MNPAERLRAKKLGPGSLPPRFADLPSPPAELYVWGELPRGPAVAIVGTRAPTEPARKFAQSLSGALAREGVAILSGGAEGIDTDAHLGALAVGGTTVVVAPAGLENPFPAHNGELFVDIVRRRGAYVSHVGPKVGATTPAFLQRNSYMVALAHVVVVVEAPIVSGARNAAAHARRLGRPLFVVPHPPWNSAGRGCILELRLGALPLDGPKDVLRALADANLHALPPPPPRRKRRHGESAAQARLRLGREPGSEGHGGPQFEVDRVLAAVRSGAAHLDLICGETGLDPPRVQHHLLTLSLRGVLVADPSGRIRLL